jgi:hypothetical protein
MRKTHDLDTLMDVSVDSGHSANLFCALNRRPEQEHFMRAALLTAALMALGVGVASVPAQAADIYRPSPAYGAAPPPAYRPAPPPVAYVAPPPVYGPPPVVAYGPPPGVITAPEGPAYLVQQPAYQPGSEYTYVDRRPYLDCWIEWGQRRCVLSPRPF